MNRDVNRDERVAVDAPWCKVEDDDQRCYDEDGTVYKEPRSQEKLLEFPDLPYSLLLRTCGTICSDDIRVPVACSYRSTQ